MMSDEAKTRRLRRPTIAGPSPDFIRRTRNPDLESPTRFEPLPKTADVVVI